MSGGRRIAPNFWEFVADLQKIIQMIQPRPQGSIDSHLVHERPSTAEPFYKMQ
jgi:hypothetical protein